MAELADAYGLGPYAERLGGSSPSVRTSIVVLLDRWMVVSLGNRDLKLASADEWDLLASIRIS